MGARGHRTRVCRVLRNASTTAVHACQVMQGRTGEHPALVNRRLALLAFGSFVVATDGTLIVGLLRRVAADLSASPSATGQSIAVFALAYAAGAPLLIVLTRRWRQERVLLAALILFAAANLATALAQSLASLLAARVLAGACAGVFTPTAAALAAVGPVKRRGRALAFVVSGASAAAIVGVPLGTILGVYLGWRSAFFLVVAMTLALIVALAKGVDRSEGSPRLDSSAYLPRGRLLMTLMVTLLWAAGSFTFFTYFAVVLHRTAGVGGLGVALYLLLFGLAGIVGVTLAGRAIDAHNGATALGLALAVVAASLLGLTVIAIVTPPHGIAAGLTAAMVLLYGLGTWGVTPPQQHRLLMNGRSGRMTLSLNASALYAGVAMGGALGGIILTTSHSITALCAVAAAIEIAAALAAWSLSL
jgi:MFS transporter, DHA1 family, inner membrane transport protein